MSYTLGYTYKMIFIFNISFNNCNNCTRTIHTNNTFSRTFYLKSYTCTLAYTYKTTFVFNFCSACLSLDTFLMSDFFRKGQPHFGNTFLYNFIVLNDTVSTKYQLNACKYNICIVCLTRFV